MGRRGVRATPRPNEGRARAKGGLPHGLQLLQVDLTRGTTELRTVNPAYTREFIGGSSLGARLLWDSLDPKRDPLDPASPLLWVTGPLTGSGGPTTGRFTICARSPQTGLWGESHIGGFVGPELRFAGWDAVLIVGQANSPVYLWLHNGQAEIRDAAHLWGKADTYETQRVIKEEVGEPMAHVACIGLAGENGVPYSCILSDHGRFAGRTGMGTLMGSKNLKALAVRGTGKTRLWPCRRSTKRLRVGANKCAARTEPHPVLRDHRHFRQCGDYLADAW